MLHGVPRYPLLQPKLSEPLPAGLFLVQLEGGEGAKGGEREGGSPGSRPRRASCGRLWSPWSGVVSLSRPGALRQLAVHAARTVVTVAAALERLTSLATRAAGNMKLFAEVTQKQKVLLRANGLLLFSTQVDEEFMQMSTQLHVFIRHATENWCRVTRESDSRRLRHSPEPSSTHRCECSRAEKWPLNVRKIGSKPP